MEQSRSATATPLVAVKGAGDLATGVIHRLVRSGFPVVAVEIAQPTALRRTVAFAEAVPLGQMTIEGVMACLAASVEEARMLLARQNVAILVDPTGALLRTIRPYVLVEATLSKRNTGIATLDAPIVIALGPGYEAGRDAHAVIETNRGHNLGRVYLQGSADPDTGVPGTIGGYDVERLLRAPCEGTLYSDSQIGDTVQAGEVIALIEANGLSVPVHTVITGILRGLIRPGLSVHTGMKIGDIDPRAVRAHCFTISDKARAVAGGVLEAILYFLNQEPTRSAPTVS